MARQNQLCWGCGCNRAQRADHDHVAVDGRDALAREPENDGFQPRHEPGCDSQADQRASEHERREPLRHGEQRRTGGSNEQQHALDPAWAVAIEHDADRYLPGAEGQEIDCGEQTEIGSPERQIRCQLTGDQGVDGPEQVGKVEAGRERQEDEQDQAPEAREFFSRSQRDVWPDRQGRAKESC